MSVILDSIQIGQSGTPTNNFVISTPASPDGSMTISRGVLGGSLTQILKINADGGVSDGAPCFSAYANATQVLTNSTFTKVAINTERFDIGSCFNTTDNRFTPNVAGYYQVNGLVRLGGTTLSQGFAVLYKNGAAWSRGQELVISAGCQALSCPYNELVYLNGTTDYIELWGYVTASSGWEFTYTGNPSATSYFSASLVRAA